MKPETRILKYAIYRVSTCAVPTCAVPTLIMRAGLSGVEDYTSKLISASHVNWHIIFAIKIVTILST